MLPAVRRSTRKQPMHRFALSLAAALCAAAVCAALAGAATPTASTAKARVYVPTGSGAHVAVKPRSIHIVSNENLGKLRWNTWGGKTAVGRGTDYANGPSEGHDSENPITIRLYGRRNCSGRLVYTKARIRFTHGVPYEGMSHIEHVPWGCPYV